MKAIVPIKHNSQRVPGKNFKELGNKPLHKWILDTLLSVSDIDEIIVDTDSNHESLIPLQSTKGISFKKRNKDLVGDQVSMNLIIRDVLENYSGDDFFMTHVTNPFLSSETIKLAINAYQKRNIEAVDSVFSASKIQGRLYDHNLRPINHLPSKLLQTQDLSPIFLENSNFYIFSRKSFLESNARIGIQPSVYETAGFESLDIDTPEDWELAEVIARGAPFNEKVKEKRLVERPNR